MFSSNKRFSLNLEVEILNTHNVEKEKNNLIILFVLVHSKDIPVNKENVYFNL